MNRKNKIFDVIIVGAGMGGMTAASLLANEGFSVLVLEAAHVPGGCSSSYKRKGYIFESGATTLIGFDQNQPLRILEEKLSISLPKVPIEPSMTVHLGEKEITRWRDQKKWIEEAQKQFGEPIEQENFWNLSFQLSELVWRISSKNNFFPPTDLKDTLQLFKNDIKDLWALPYAIKSVKQVARELGIANPEFFRFLDEQLLISAQSKSEDTPFLFGAPAITYTNYTNYYVPGGLIQLVNTLKNFIEEKGSRVQTKERVLDIHKTDGKYYVKTSKNKTYKSKSVVSNIPIWNLPDITSGEISEYFSTESLKYQDAWGAFTVGLVTKDRYPKSMSLHHQIHLNESEHVNGIDSGSVFVSLSAKNDEIRAPKGERILNVSAHTKPDYWFHLNGSYDSQKKMVQEQIVDTLDKRLPGFSKADVKLVFSASPVTWQKWIYRKKGRVGGIPQSMMRSLFDWTPSEPPFDRFFLCGDTVFPGQGIPGVTLSGINVYLRIKKTFNYSRKFFELPG